MKEQRSPEGRAGGASRASRVVTRKGYAEERTGAERGKERGRQNKQGGKENGGAGDGTEGGQKESENRGHCAERIRYRSRMRFQKGVLARGGPRALCQKERGCEERRGAEATGREENGEGKSAAAIRERRDYRRTRPSLTLTKENRYA